jgi:hypothetical protein
MLSMSVGVKHGDENRGGVAGTEGWERGEMREDVVLENFTWTRPSSETSPVGQFLESQNSKRVKSYGQLKFFYCKIQKKEKNFCGAPSAHAPQN